MFLRGNIERFLEHEKYIGTTYALYFRKLELVVRYEEERRKPAYMLSCAEMIDLITRLSDNAAVQRRVKNLLYNYFEWLIDEGIDAYDGSNIISSIDLSQIKTAEEQYVYGPHELLSRLESDIIYVTTKGHRERNACRMIVSSVILLWHGLTVEEVVEVTKVGVLRGENAVSIKDKALPIHPKAYPILVECANATYFERRLSPATNRYNYQDSEYLLRTENEMCMSVGTLRSTISQFNREIEGVPYKIDKIYWSGMFYRAYKIEVERGRLPDVLPTELQFYENLFGEKYKGITQIKTRLRQYNAFTAIYRNA